MDLITQQYDRMVNYATALQLGTADSEQVLRRFTRSDGPKHRDPVSSWRWSEPGRGERVHALSPGNFGLSRAALTRRADDSQPDGDGSTRSRSSGPCVDLLPRPASDQQETCDSEYSQQDDEQQDEPHVGHPAPAVYGWGRRAENFDQDP
ncbi:MAG: Tn3 family transposase [Pseudonocardiales bacterium]|nr:Tn3 family transposase [Pseudonocardiales bacterium]